MVKVLNNLSNENGQAIFEFVVFLPVLVLMFSIIVNIGNAINASINQQQATRRYAFYLQKGSSISPSARSLALHLDMQKMDLVAIGWANEFDGKNPISSCFKFQSLFGDSKGDETCEKEDYADKGSKFIRVYTVFGWCGATYSREGGNSFKVNQMNIIGPGVRDPCFISK